jgi:hypothetical protein
MPTLPRLTAALALPFALGLLGACATRPPHVAAAPSPGPGWRYEIVAREGARELSAAALFPPGSPAELGVESGADAFVKDVELLDPQTGDWKRVARKGAHWVASECIAGCTVRYRFLLEDAAMALHDIDLAARDGGVFVSTPSLWLLRPCGAPATTPATFHVTTPPDVEFVSGVNPDAGGEPHTYRAIASDLELAPYSVFGALRTHRLYQDGATLEVAIAPGDLAMRDEDIDRWVSVSVSAVTSFYHRFPLPNVLLVVIPTKGDEVEHGRTLAGGGASIVLHVGKDMTSAGISDDWVLTHELTHLAFPTVPRRYAWLEEGLATYVEPIARARVGVVPIDEVWRGLVLGLPKGLPRAGDRGLDVTHTWGRTYWGGALFCLVADIQIRAATWNQHGLEDALRGILDAGGNDAVRWDLERALAVGDRAVGAHVLRDLHARMGTAPVEIDLPALFRQLGVQMRGRAMVFDETAPLAAVRRAITVTDGPRMGLVAQQIPSCDERGPLRVGPCVTPGTSLFGR